MTDLVEVEVLPDRLLEGLRNAAKRIRKTRVCALVLNPRTPPPAPRIRNRRDNHLTTVFGAYAEI